MHVLVVDDDSLTRMLMKRMLVRMGCHVLTAENGEIAVEMIMGGSRPTPSSEGSSRRIGSEMGAEEGGHDGRFAAIFLDNQMPVLSGLQTVSRLREAGRKDFVIGVTGNALLGDQEEFLEAGK
jgi:osomolarity two-component system, sensor histidine kinase SLN1